MKLSCSLRGERLAAEKIKFKGSQKTLGFLMKVLDAREERKNRVGEGKKRVKVGRASADLSPTVVNSEALLASNFAGLRR